MQYETTFGIAAPPADVWAVLIDVERWPTWTPSVVKITRQDRGPFGPDSSVRIVQPAMASLVWDVSDFRPQESLSWRYRRPGISTTADHELQPAGDNDTRVTLRVTFSGPLGRLAWWLTRRRTRRYVDQEAAGLKERCESSP